MYKYTIVHKSACSTTSDMYKFELVPDSQIKSEKIEVKSHAKVKFKVYEFDKEFDFWDSYTDQGYSVSKADSWYVGEKRITFSCSGLIDTAVAVNPDEKSRILQSWKERLPNLLRGLVAKNTRPRQSYVDLMTGKEVDYGATVQYEFTDQVVQTTEQVTEVPGYIVFTSCALVNKPTMASFDQLNLVYDPNLVPSTLATGCYGFSAFGKIQLNDFQGPVSLADLRKNHSDQVIESAFRRLALELAKADQLKAVAGWTSKQLEQ